MHLANEAHIGGALDVDARACDTRLGKQRAALGFKVLKNAVDRGRIVTLLDPSRVGAHALEAEGRNQEAEARGGARRWRDDNFANPKNASDTGCVRGPGTTEADHRIGARVLALLNQMDAGRRRHAFGDHLMDTVGGFDRGQADFIAELGDRHHRCLAVEHHTAAEEESRIVEAEYQVGVGHRRLGPAAAVACGTRLGASRTRAHPQQTDFVDAGD